MVPASFRRLRAVRRLFPSEGTLAMSLGGSFVRVVVGGEVLSRMILHRVVQVRMSLQCSVFCVSWY